MPRVNRTSLEVVEGDITDLDVVAIVNAANRHLKHGGGLAAAVARRGGPAIQAESDAWVREHGPLRTGACALTSGGRLPARHVIHAVGPVYDGTPASAVSLSAAVRSALAMADERGFESLALPAISTGIFGYPIEEAAGVIVDAVMAYLEGETRLERVVLCLYGDHAYRAFASRVPTQG